MKIPWMLLVLVLLLVLFQAQLWIGDGSVSQQKHLKAEIEAQQEANDALRHSNDGISLEIRSLGDQVENDEGLEERARSDLGMIAEGEVFYMMVDKKPSSPDDVVDDGTEVDGAEVNQAEVSESQERAEAATETEAQTASPQPDAQNESLSE